MIALTLTMSIVYHVTTVDYLDSTIVERPAFLASCYKWRSVLNLTVPMPQFLQSTKHDLKSSRQTVPLPKLFSIDRTLKKRIKYDGAAAMGVPYRPCGNATRSVAFCAFGVCDPLPTAVGIPPIHAQKRRANGARWVWDWVTLGSRLRHAWVTLG